MPWAGMAVLVRSGRASIPPLRRALAAAGVPVEVAGDDTPLVREPAVVPLLVAPRAVLHIDETTTRRPDYLHPRPRRPARLAARRARRHRAPGPGPPAPGREQAPREGEPPRPLDRRAGPRGVARPDAPRGLEGEPVRRARRRTALPRAAAVLDEGGTAEDVLWALWSGTHWPSRLRAAAARGGTAPGCPPRPRRDLRAVRHRGPRPSSSDVATSGAATSLRDHAVAQQIPADTLADRGVRGDAVRLLTAHRAKGLEWPLVVVAHAQEEALARPAPPHHPAAGGPDRADDAARRPSRARELLAEERRLFYVAATRARELLLVTAVASPDDDGEQPSRFLAELGVDPRHVQGRPAARCRCRAWSPSCGAPSPTPTAPALRDAAARRLARLSGGATSGRPLAPAADPATWWGTRAITAADPPSARPTAGAGLGERLPAIDCPARWFLEREAGGAARPASRRGSATWPTPWPTASPGELEPARPSTR